MKNKSRLSTLFGFSALVLFGGIVTGCLGSARASITAPKANYQVSSSPVLKSPENSGEAPKVSSVGKFEMPFKCWSLLYGLARLDPEVDLSDAINAQVGKFKGNAIVNFRIEAHACPINGAPLLSLLPVWPSCVEGKVTGDIIRIEQPTS